MKNAMIQARLKALLEMAENPKMQDDNSPDYISDGEMLDIFLKEIENIMKYYDGSELLWSIADLKEQMQENLLTYFDAIALGTQAQHTEAMDGMCDIVIKTINEYER